MDVIAQAELFATKGMEYAAVLVYLGLFVGFWRLLWSPEEDEAGSETAPDGSHGRLGGEPEARKGGWFSLPDGFLFHQGHAWVRPEGHGVFRVGMDEFIRKLLGSRASSFRLPAEGVELSQGEEGWKVEVAGKALPILSPTDGEVVEVNPLALEEPETIMERPYADDGWLLKVRVSEAEARSSMTNLLSGAVARAWIRAVEERIRAMHSPELGLALPDGGEPVDGLARALHPERWDEVARELLLVD